MGRDGGVKRGGAGIGTILLLVVLLAGGVPGLQAGALAAAGGPGGEPARAQPEALPAELASVGATEGWWAAAQANIRADLGLPQEAGGVDGLSAAPDWDATGEQVNDLFGISVAGAGDVDGDGYADVIVGAPGIYGVGKEGKAYVFYGSATGLESSPTWSQSGENDDDNFGSSVAGAGDVNGDGYADVIVGAYTHAPAGRVYIFLGSSTGLSLSPLPPFDGEASGDSFGYAVAGAGDVNGDGYADILVSDRGFNSATGRVYVYHGGAGGPDATTDRVLDGEGVQDWFGYSVAGAGDVDGDGYADIIIGAIGYDAGAATQAGAAYAFYGGADGVSQTWDWGMAGGSRDDWFGSSVAGAGDVNGDGYADVIVGAKYYGGDSAGAPEPGAAYVYHGSTSGLPDVNWDWRIIGENDGDLYGCSVAGAGDVNGDGYADVIVGAEEYAGAGRAYVYRGGAGGVAGDPAWTDDGEGSDDAFATCVAGAGDVNGDGYADVIVGADEFSSLQGKAYAYHGAGDGPGDNDQWGEEGINTGDWFGFSVAGAGDVNADGYSDVLVGAQQFDSSRGRVYLYLGAGDGLPAFSDWSADGENGDDWFGGSVAGAGDVNGDGYADVIIGARGYDDGGNADAGKAYVFYGETGGLGSDPWEVVGEAGNSKFGFRVASAGDVNGDGYADILVSAPDYDSQRGKVYAYYGAADGPGTSADRTYEGATSWELFGSGVAGVGDANGDGYADVAIGAEGYPSPGGSPAWQGMVQLYVGGDSGLSPISVWTGLGENDGDRFGQNVAGAGDVSGDGCGDILVGAPAFGGARGKVYLYDGGCGGGVTGPVWSGTGMQGVDAFGSAVAGAGDVNGDGYADVLVGAPQSPAGAYRGSAYLYTGPLSGISYEGDWDALGENTGDRFGVAVAGAGDINGDGYADVLVGANMYDSSRGKVYAYPGNDGGGQLVLARPMRLDSKQIQPWGLADAQDAFQVRMGATNPAGRGRIRLEAEACPPGAAFGDAACVTALDTTWFDTVPTGGLPLPRGLDVTLAGLEGDTLYRWRARVLYAPYTVLKPGITPPPNPAHGPWRRFQAQAFEADVRMPASWQVFLPLVQR